MTERIKVTTESLLQKQAEWERLLQQAYHLGTEAVEELTALETCFQAERLMEWKRQLCVWAEGWRNAYTYSTEHLKKLSLTASVYDLAERSNTDVFTSH